MLTLRCGSQKEIEYFTFMAAHIGTIARRATYFTDDALCESIVTLVLGKSERQCLQYFFKKVLQSGKISRETDGNRRKVPSLAKTVAASLTKRIKKPSEALRADGLTLKPNENNLPYLPCDPCTFAEISF